MPKSNGSSEVRGGKLITAIKGAIPGAGFVKLDPTSDGRRVFFEFHKMDFVLSSRLHVQECGFGRLRPERVVTDETKELSARFHRNAVPLLPQKAAAPSA